MRRKSGLRSEIIINIALLMAAALLFSGFLLIKLTERELIAQRLKNVTGLLEVLASAIPQELPVDAAAGNDLLLSTLPLLQKLSSGSSMEGWGVADREAKPLAVSAQTVAFRLEEAALTQVKYSGESTARIVYSSSWLPFRPAPESYILVTVPVQRRGDFIGALQARFALNEVRDRVQSAQKLVLLYVVLYGTVLVAFGVYFLSRTVVQPIKRLQGMSQRIAAGDMELAVPIEGPRELADLAGAFNVMVAALRKSYREREVHIQALQQANEDVRQAQNELIRSEKMVAVGHLAAGMAHEIGNPLGAVVGYLEFLKGEAPPGRERQIVERALAETERIDRLVRELLDYAAPASRDQQVFDPVAALAEARDILLQQGALDRLEIDDRLPPALPGTAMARHQLIQVFINLLLNARDASADGGTIRLCGGEEEAFVWLSVADAGGGMAPEVLAHIFDPFYTTKAPGKGRGLGLAVCQRILGDAGGRVEVESIPGQGSEFTVWLKKAEPAGHEC